MDTVVLNSDSEETTTNIFIYLFPYSIYAMIFIRIASKMLCVYANIFQSLQQ